MILNITRLLTGYFPSSRPANLLYVLPHIYSLPSREPFSRVLVSNSHFNGAGKLVRLYRLSFSIGLLKTDLCRYGIAASYEDGAENGITAICETKFELLPDRWEHTADRTHSRGVDAWTFDSKFETFERFLILLKGLTPQEIPGNHPLLNPVDGKPAPMRRPDEHRRI